MAYLVRKLIRYESVLQFGMANDVSVMLADAATTEFRTKNGTLSTWKINSIDEINEAVLAIVVTSSKVEKMDFIAIDTNYLSQESLSFKQTYAGQDIAVSDLQDTHHDIFDITIPKLINCANIYKKVFLENQNNGKYIIRYAQGEIIDLLKRSENRINKEILNSGIKKVL